MLKKEQLIQTIAAGIDDHDQRIILLPSGEFQLVPYRNESDAIGFKNIDYVTHFGTLDAGNDYVGIAASKDEVWINRVFQGAQQVWEKYSATGNRPITNMML